jgi:hypothetical protein
MYYEIKSTSGKSYCAKYKDFARFIPGLIKLGYLDKCEVNNIEDIEPVEFTIKEGCPIEFECREEERRQFVFDISIKPERIYSIKEKEGAIRSINYDCSSMPSGIGSNGYEHLYGQH